MSENLKRAESLFNRIMNQNKPEAKTTLSGGSHRNNHSNQNSSSSGNNHHRSSYRSHRNHQNNSNNSNNQNNRNEHPGNSHSGGHGRPENGSHSHKEAQEPHHSILANIDLPKRDPVKEAQAAVALVPENHHILPYCWTVWHHSRSKTTKSGEESGERSAVSSEGESAASKVSSADAAASASAAVDSYLQTTKEIEFRCVSDPDSTTKSIASVEQLWSSLSQTKRAYELHHSTQLLIFKTGINPVWEDPINAKGGRWVFRFGRRSHPGSVSDKDPEMSARVRQRTSMIWERLVLRTLTGSLIPDKQYSKHVKEQLLSDISGLALSIRRDEDIVSLWNSNLHFGRRRGGEDEDKKPLQPFQARRIMCDAILRVIRECDLILQGSDCVETMATMSSERVAGVSFEYRLHAESNSTTMYWDRMRRKHHHHKDDQTREQPQEEVVA